MKMKQLSIWALCLLIIGCQANRESSEKQESETESGQAEYLFLESTGNENNWLVEEQEIKSIIESEERLQAEEAIWIDNNLKQVSDDEEVDFRMFSLFEAEPILMKLASQESNFIIPIPIDSGYAEFEFSEFEGFSMDGAKFFVGKNSQEPSLEASIFLRGNQMDISVNSLEDNLLLTGIPFTSSTTNRYDFIVKSNRNRRIAKKSKFESGLIKNVINKKAKRRTTQIPKLEHRRLRIAVAATGEYTAFHGQEDTFNQIVSDIARVSMILFRELGLRVILVSDETLIYTDSLTDPFDNDNLDSLLDQNQILMDSIIGNDNYDVGHVFSTNPDGGLASLASAGVTGKKAMGASGGRFPVGDPFTVDYVTHEIGHQLGANHTFTSASCGLQNRNDSTSIEPGSGSTIMSYAGICTGDNLQFSADMHFHTISYDEIMEHLDQINLETFQTNNSAPIVNPTTVATTIPMLTPFVLSAEAFDDEQDFIYYSWDQLDVDLAPVDLGDQTEFSPLFRSYPISMDSFRIFPSLDLLLDQFTDPGELLPNRARKINFSCVVRDLRGGINYEDISLDVTDMAGPFEITTPNTFVSWNKNTLNSVAWNPANTDLSPVNCDSVDIFLTVDRGFNLIPLGRFLNNGTAAVQIGDMSTTKARIWIQASNNVFFDISDNDFEIK